MKEINLYNTQNRTVENVGVMRASFDNEPVVYASIFGFFSNTPLLFFNNVRRLY